MGLMREPAGTVHNHVFSLQLFSLILPCKTDQSNFHFKRHQRANLHLKLIRFSVNRDVVWVTHEVARVNRERPQTVISAI